MSRNLTVKCAVVHDDMRKTIVITSTWCESFILCNWYNSALYAIMAFVKKLINSLWVNMNKLNMRQKTKASSSKLNWFKRLLDVVGLNKISDYGMFTVNETVDWSVWLAII